MSRGWKFLHISVLLLTLCVGVTPSFAASTIGGKCPKANTFTLIGNKVVICSKNGSKLIWALANTAQKTTYKLQQQKLQLTNRRQAILDLQSVKVKYLDLTSVLSAFNQNLIQNKKNLIDTQRSALIDLQKQQETEKQNRNVNSNSLANINTSITTNQASLNSLQSQINGQQGTINSAKASNDASYNAYLSAKAQSDYLYAGYSYAYRDNASMLAIYITCTFGFTSCAGYNASQYNYNASIINSYNSASARTSGAYASYASYNGQYVAELNNMNALKNQQSSLSASTSTLNTQKNQMTQSIASSDSKLANLEVAVNNAMLKFVPFENAEKRINDDAQKYIEITNSINLKNTDFGNAIDNFMQTADETFITTVSASTWDSKIGEVKTLQKDVDQRLVDLKVLTTALEIFLNTI